MRAGLTLLVVAAVAALGAAAAVDALRGDSEGVAPPRERSTEREIEAGQPLEGGPRGVLHYTDDDCVLQAVELPTLQPVETPAWEDCRFSLSPDGNAVRSAAAIWDPSGTGWATEAGRRIVVASAPSTRVSFEGEAPSFKPDGTLTFVHAGAVRALRGDCGRSSGSAISLADEEMAACSRVLLGPEDLRRALGRDPNVPDNPRVVRNFRVEETAWLSDTRLAAILAVDIRFGPHAEMVAVYEGRRALDAALVFGDHLSDLRVSPHGSFVAARGAEGFVYLDRDLRTVPAPPARNIRAVAWSPDERWAAFATDASVHVFHTATGEPRLRRWGVVARDLAWREPDEPLELPIAEGGRVRELLAEAGAGGMLYLADDRCRLRALHLPELDWAATDGSACRFSLTPNGEFLPDGVVVQPRNLLRAVCREGRIEVSDRNGIGLGEYRGACAPAWKPNGALTFVRDGELVLASRPGVERVVISRADLAADFGESARLQEVAWMDEERLWGVVRTASGAELAAFSGTSRSSALSYSSEAIEGLRVSEGMVAARTDEGIVFVDGTGRRLLTVRGGREMSWAPDRPIAAVAGPGEIIFVAPLSREVAGLALPALDLEWR